MQRKTLRFLASALCLQLATCAVGATALSSVSANADSVHQANGLAEFKIDDDTADETANDTGGGNVLALKKSFGDSKKKKGKTGAAGNKASGGNIRRSGQGAEANSGELPSCKKKCGGKRKRCVRSCGSRSSDCKKLCKASFKSCSANCPE